MTPQHRQGNCAACDTPFTKEDDVVICPECGAPYHRACYTKEGHCLFEEKHGAGFEYSNPKQNIAQQEAAEETENDPAQQGIVCHNCGTVNVAKNIFCEGCGAPLREDNTAQLSSLNGGQPGWQGQPQTPPSPQAFQQPPMRPAMFTFPPVAAFDLNGEIDGFPKRDWVDFIGPSAQLYLHRFTTMQYTKTKLSFSPSAFFLGPFFFAYRKMWGWAAITFANVLVVNAFNLLWFLSTKASPLVAGIPVGTLDVLSNLFFYIGFGVQLFFGIFAVYLYRRHIGKKLTVLRQQNQAEPEYRLSLMKNGGASGLGIGIVFGILFLLAAVLSQWIGPELLQYYYASIW